MYYIEVNNRLGIKVSDAFLVDILNIVPHNQRDKVFEIFKKYKDIKEVSDTTLNLVREKILQRYEEWKPEIEEEIRKDAREYAKQRAEQKKMPTVIAWVVGIGSFIMLAVIFSSSTVGPGLAFGSFFGSIAIGMFTGWQVEENIISKFESEEILRKGEEEKKSLETIM